MFAAAVRGVPEARCAGLSRSGGLWIVREISTNSTENAALRYVFSSGDVSRAASATVELVRVEGDGIRESFRAPAVYRMVDDSIGIFGANVWGRDWSRSSMRGAGCVAFDVRARAKRWTLERGLSAIFGSTAYGTRGVFGEEKLIALDLATGAERWSCEMREPSLTTDGERVFALDRVDVVHALGPDGTKLWSRKVESSGNLCRTLAWWGGGVWHVNHPREGFAALERLDPRTGATDDSVELPLAGWVSDLFALPAGLLVQGEMGLFLVSDGVREVSPIETEKLGVKTDGAGFAAVDETGKTLLLSPDAVKTHAVALSFQAEGLSVADGHVAIWGYEQSDKRASLPDRRLFLRVPLAHEGDLTMTVVDLAGGAREETLGTKKKLSKRKPSAPAVALAKTLRELDLLPDTPELDRLLLATFRKGKLPAAAVAILLQEVHGTDGGAERGFLCHDWRFGQETSDVIAEFQRALAGEPVSFRQISITDGAIEVEIDGRRRETIEVESLQDVADFLDGELSRAKAKRRIHTLTTDGDWHAYLVRPRSDFARLPPQLDDDGDEDEE